MDAADYLSRSSRNLRSSVETFTDEVEGELEKYSICGVYLTRKVTAPICAGLVLLACVIRLGAVLSATGVTMGNFVAQSLIDKVGEEEDLLYFRTRMIRI